MGEKAISTHEILLSLVYFLEDCEESPLEESCLKGAFNSLCSNHKALQSLYKDPEKALEDLLNFSPLVYRENGFVYMTSEGRRIFERAYSNFDRNIAEILYGLSREMRSIIDGMNGEMKK